MSSVIYLHNPPVNSMSLPTRERLVSEFQAAVNSASVKHIVLTGKGSHFCAGADIKEFATGVSGNYPNLRDISRIIESNNKSSVAAIHGSCLGGGLEIALACHYRIATLDSRIGFPEVTLGILPAATGSQKLPRLIGIRPALETISTGRVLSAKEALALGIIDKLIDRKENLVSEAKAFIEGKPVRRISELNVRDSREEAESMFEVGMSMLRKRAPRFLAPQYCMRAVIASLLPYEEGLKREKELAAELFASDQSKALRYAFFSERSSTKVSKVQPNNVKFAAVIGAGAMGSGIAACFVSSGITTVLIEQDAKFLEEGVERIHSIFASRLKRKKITERRFQEIKMLLRPSNDYTKLSKIDLAHVGRHYYFMKVVEAVYENMDLKKRIFAQLDKATSPHCILATNTSTLDIDEIASVTSRPDKVIGMHFFAPPHVMRLLENVRGKKTSDVTIATAMSVGRKLGKIPVLVGNCYAFCANRMYAHYNAEAAFLLESGSTPAEIDRVLEEFGMAMGVFKVRDLSGLDVGKRIQDERFKALELPPPASKRYRNGEEYSPFNDLMIRHNRLGVKSGKGFYMYERGSRSPKDDPEFVSLLRQFRTEYSIPQRAHSNEEIIERCLFPIINEGFKCLEDGIAPNAQTIDIIWLNGFGWPRYTGGPMYYASQVGLRKIYDKISHYYAQFPHRSYWQPSRLLRSLALATSQPDIEHWCYSDLPNSHL